MQRDACPWSWGFPGFPKIFHHVTPLSCCHWLEPFGAKPANAASASSGPRGPPSPLWSDGCPVGFFQTLLGVSATTTTGYKMVVFAQLFQLGRNNRIDLPLRFICKIIPPWNRLTREPRGVSYPPGYSHFLMAAHASLHTLQFCSMSSPDEGPAKEPTVALDTTADEDKENSAPSQNDRGPTPVLDETNSSENSIPCGVRDQN